MSNNSQYKYVLYGSGMCKNTKEFITQLSQYPNLNKLVMKIDIHDKLRRHQVLFCINSKVQIR